ncbi:hypothetical protein DC498_25795 [Terrimonas sp.]|jgi:hypothetical protein|uniref:hypothetical protein n=1 Tax=Terrimonas sp. TaxID=1914338 RepID=UPI000D50CFB7|nr:hypothetical protein [Terrimonas sp.]PVD49290.1 hypothetical protein DC498_25795 [Terrimonas sp.]
MKQTILILTFALTTLLCYGQKEHLEPAKDFKQYEGVLKEYYDNVFPKLYKGFSQTPYARYTSMPSFSKEYAFSVETIDGKHYIISNSFSENFWYAKKRNTVKLISNKTEIDNILYSKIGELFQILAEQTKIPEKETMGLDGVSYYFATTDTSGQIKTGETWSPNDNSLLDKLVNVCDKLFSQDSKKNIIKTDILNEIETLIEEFKK